MDLYIKGFEMPIERQAIPGLGVIATFTASFTTNAETDEIGVGGLGKIIVLGVTPIGSTIAALDNLGVDETIDSNGVINVDADNEITIRREAGGTSGLSYSLTVIGY